MSSIVQLKGPSVPDGATADDVVAGQDRNVSVPVVATDQAEAVVVANAEDNRVASESTRSSNTNEPGEHTSANVAGTVPEASDGGMVRQLHGLKIHASTLMLLTLLDDDGRVVALNVNANSVSVDITSKLQNALAGNPIQAVQLGADTLDSSIMAAVITNKPRSRTECVSVTNVSVNKCVFIFQTMSEKKRTQPAMVRSSRIPSLTHATCTMASSSLISLTTEQHRHHIGRCNGRNEQTDASDGHGLYTG